jgi:hypothetical protein
MITAFQIGAFQFTAFQEGGVTGSGDLPAWMRAALLRGRRKRKPVEVDEDEEEQEVVEVAARSQLRLRARLPMRADLGPLLAMVKAHDEAEFRELVDAIMASEDLADA